jgi:hypothetical protein
VRVLDAHLTTLPAEAGRVAIENPRARLALPALERERAEEDRTWVRLVLRVWVVEPGALIKVQLAPTERRARRGQGTRCFVWAPVRHGGGPARTAAIRLSRRSAASV